jgi:FMN phosphatase YigB (HAD superfamily)
LPGDCLFLDDDPTYVAAAIALGYHGLAVLREPGQTAHGVPAIRSIDELLTRI